MRKRVALSDAPVIAGAAPPPVVAPPVVPVPPVVPPPPVPGFWMTTLESNTAVTRVGTRRSNVQAGPADGQPRQPAKCEPGLGTAVSVTRVPTSNLAVHVLPQLTPTGSVTTAPAPVPSLSTATAIGLPNTRIAVPRLAEEPTETILPSGCSTASLELSAPGMPIAPSPSNVGSGTPASVSR